MALEEYRRKRDFSKTPEPAGKAVRGAPERFFCVQKHLASHLHYDFRLEHNGVLLSWAVPKGPHSIEGKRLAMHVEDHPMDYGDFEGVIPEGYGAGIVMLWDRGTWRADVPDVDAALKKGDLKFTLNGYKLKGSWVLGGGVSRAPRVRREATADQTSRRVVGVSTLPRSHRAT
jgi:bifunctional non-homologous end joining protein LigD